MLMKTKIQIAVAVLVMIAAGYWALSSMRTQRFVGNNIMFPIGSGYVIATNTGDTPMPIEMRSGGRLATFRIESSQLGLAESARREGSGREAYYALKFELPPGQARIDVTRGSDVQMIARGEHRIEAVVMPMAPGSLRWIQIGAAVVILYGLFYISRVTGHNWLKALRNRQESSGSPATTQA
jgi:hypothetical protein